MSAPCPWDVEGSDSFDEDVWLWESVSRYRELCMASLPLSPVSSLGLQAVSLTSTQKRLVRKQRLAGDLFKTNHVTY